MCKAAVKIIKCADCVLPGGIMRSMHDVPLRHVQPCRHELRAHRGRITLHFACTITPIALLCQQISMERI